MDPHIENLKSTTFFGRRFTRRQIAEVQQTVAMFPALSRKELGQTICEHPQLAHACRRQPRQGRPEAAGATRAGRHPDAAAQAGREHAPGPRKPPAATRRSDPQPVIEARLRDLEPLRLQVVEQAAETRLWNELRWLRFRGHFGVR